MRFKGALEKTPGLENSYEPGLQALRRPERTRIFVSDPRTLTGSVDLDHALRRSQPDAPRWDYGVGLRGGTTDRVVWIEVHPASTKNVKEVISKLDWLRDWLRDCAPLLLELKEPSYHWLASNGVHILRNSPQARQLALKGLGMLRRHLNL